MNQPYIFTTPRVPIQQEDSFDNTRGITYKQVEGEHAIWAARLPFLPAMLSNDFVRPGNQRIQLIQLRQVRFIYDLVRTRENRATFELRFIATKNPIGGQPIEGQSVEERPIEGQPNLIDIVFLGKVFSQKQGAAKVLAQKLWARFSSVFPVEDPFNYPLEAVLSEQEFRRYYEPIPFQDIQPTNVLEIRKYEEMPIPSAAPLGRVARKGDYIAHPFVPSTAFSPMGRFLTALAAQPNPCFVGVSLRPTRMYDQEVHNVSFAIGQFKRTATEDDDVTEEYIRSRSALGAYVHEKLMQEREQLATVRVQIVGQRSDILGLAEALGSEMMGNLERKYPTQWVAAQPANQEEMTAARNNLEYLDQEMWGHTLASPPLARLRYLVSAEEAYGAFRLPVPPESGYMPGVLVKNEPFVAPADELELRRQARANLNDVASALAQAESASKISLGVVYHRGNPTAQQFRIPVKDLTRHTLIGGSTGSGKSTTIKNILAQLWLEHRVPFLVLYPIDKPDYRDLLGFQELAKDLVIFTLGDEGTSPFRFNPFEAPEGVLLKTHLSRLMRVFMAAFTLQDPLPMIYREALRRVYRDKGWDPVLDRGGEQREYPMMSDFYATIKDITDKLDYGREVKDNVRQASVIRIADLLENAGYVVNVPRSMSLQKILNQPTVMELGRVGSVQDTSLLMGFLLMRFAEEVERNPRPLTHPHITVVEEAHRLMADTGTSSSVVADSRGAAGEDFANILAEVRGYGEGIIIAEQIPTLLVKGAIGNTYLKLMHWLEDAPSFDLFGSIMNLDAQQREYARTLTSGFAIVRNAYGRPVHIKVPEFGDQSGYLKPADDATNDAAIHNWMQQQRAKLELEDVAVEKWSSSLAAGNERNVAVMKNAGWRAEPQTLAFLMAAPMQTCLFCRALHETQECRYGQATRNQIIAKDKIHQQLQAQFDETTKASDLDIRARELDKLHALLDEYLNESSAEKRQGMFYCYLAHEANTLFEDSRKNGLDNKAQRRNARTVLQQVGMQAKSATASR